MSSTGSADAEVKREDGADEFVSAMLDAFKQQVDGGFGHSPHGLGDDG